MTLSAKRPRGTLIRLLPLLALLLATGCATVPKEVYLVEPSSKLEHLPQVYVRASGPTLRNFVASLGEKEIFALAESLRPADAKKASGANDPSPTKADLSSLDDILKRSRTIGAGIRGFGAGNLGMDIVLVGDFLPFSLRLGLAFDGSWRRTEDGGYRSTKYPLFIRPPEPGIVRLSTESVAQPLLTNQAKVFPPAFDSLSNSDFFVSINEPLTVLSLPIPTESTDLPIKALAIAGSYTEAYLLGKGEKVGETAAPNYSVEVRILMKDEASARAYRPIVRFLWAAAADRLFGRGSPASQLNPAQEKDCYVVRGIELDREALERLFEAASLGFR